MKRSQPAQVSPGLTLGLIFGAGGRGNVPKLDENTVGRDNPAPEDVDARFNPLNEDANRDEKVEAPPDDHADEDSPDSGPPMIGIPDSIPGDKSSIVSRTGPLDEDEDGPALSIGTVTDPAVPA